MAATRDCITPAPHVTPGGRPPVRIPRPPSLPVEYLGAASETIAPPSLEPGSRFPRAAVALEAELLSRQLKQIARDVELLAEASAKLLPGTSRRILNSARAKLAQLAMLAICVLMVVGCGFNELPRDGIVYASPELGADFVEALDAAVAEWNASRLTALTLVVAPPDGSEGAFVAPATPDATWLGRTITGSQKPVRILVNTAAPASRLVMMHEIGHALGFRDHIEDDPHVLMYPHDGGPRDCIDARTAGDFGALLGVRGRVTCE